MNNLQCRRERMKRISIILTVPLLLFCYTAVLGETRGVTKDTIIMGHITADTGPVAKDAQAISEGIRNYVSHLNEQGGIYGRKIKIISEDSGYSIPRALTAFKKLLSKDMVFTLFGPTSTGEATALFSQIQKEKICTLQISPGGHMFDPFKRYVFHYVLTYENQVKILFDYILSDMKAKNPKIAIVYPDVEAGKSGAREARNQAKIFGVELQEEVLNLNSLDASSQVLSMKRYKPDFVIVHNLIAQASLLLREARKLGFKTNFLGTLISTNSDTIALSKEAARGFVGVHPFRSWYNDAPGVKKMRHITLKLCPGTEKPWRSEYYTLGWVNAMLFTEGMKKAGKDLTNENLVNAMESIKNFDAWGLSGPVTWGTNDREGSVSGILLKADVDNGIVVPISGWREALPR
ncbi:MAG: ABC transporter substrate-binding protein [Thermodesulfobacteriota bacterium]